MRLPFMHAVWLRLLPASGPPADREVFYEFSASRLVLRHVAEAYNVAETYLHNAQ
jgi:hypothetical protein